jgi:hypothetical protein
MAGEAETVAGEARLLADLVGGCDSVFGCLSNSALDRVRVVVEFYGLRSNDKTGAHLQNVEDGERQLESGVTDSDPTVLSHGTNVPRGGSGDCRHETSEEEADATRNRRGRGGTPAGEAIIVPTQVISPRKFRKMLYDTPKSRRIELDIEASSPVDVFVVEKNDLEEWRKRKDYGGMGFFKQKKLKQPIKLARDFQNDWYLIIENRSDAPVAVHYEVYDL